MIALAHNVQYALYKKVEKMKNVYTDDLEEREPEYLYIVSEYLTTFECDPNKTLPFEHTQYFEGNNLLKCRVEAYKWYCERSEGLIKAGQYFLPFASPQDFVMGKNACYNITLSLLQYYSDDNQTAYTIFGDSPDETAEGLELEKIIFAQRLSR